MLSQAPQCQSQRVGELGLGMPGVLPSFEDLIECVYVCSASARVVCVFEACIAPLEQIVV